MTLSNLIRKRDTVGIATAIPAISATQPKGEVATVARIATVAVANPKEEKTAPPAKVGAGDTAPASQLAVPMTADQEQAVLAWLGSIGEDDPAIVGDVLNRCQHDAECRDYYLRRAAEHDEGNPIAQPELAGDFQ